MNGTRRPPLLLSIGLVFTIVKCVLTMLTIGLGLLLFLGIVAAGSVPVLDEGHKEQIVGLSVFGISGTALFATLLFLQAIKIFVCLKAWSCDRFWLLVVIAIVVIGLVTEGPTTYGCCLFVPVLVDVAILIGAVQALSGDTV